MLHILAASMQDPTADDIIKIVAISGGLVIGFCAMVLSLLGSILRGMSVERSRREIAAYVSEGSMTADEGERLLKAGKVKNWT